MIGAPGVTACAHHVVEPRGRKARKLRERLVEEGQIGVDRRGALHGAVPGQAGLGEHARDGVAVQPELHGDGADAPALGVVVAQDLRFVFRGQGHGGADSVRIADRGAEPGSAGSPDARTGTVRGGTGGTARSRTVRTRARSAQSSLQQAGPGVENPDASLPGVARGSGAGVARAPGAPQSSPGSACRLPAARPRGHAGRSRRRNSAAPDHSGCRSALPRGTRHRDSVVRSTPWALRPVGDSTPAPTS